MIDKVKLMPDIAIPIVFPDYLIAVNTPQTSIDVPDWLPGIPDEIEIPNTQNKLPELGHAGMLFINGRTGTTKYYEYGRYRSSKGNTRKIPISDVTVNNTGHPTRVTLAYTLSEISARSGQHGRISGAYIEVPSRYTDMLNYALRRMRENNDPNRRDYALLSNSCNHFMQGVLQAAGVEVPAMIDPRPTSYIEEIRNSFRDLDYNPREKGVTLESPPSDASGWLYDFFGQPAGG